MTNQEFGITRASGGGYGPPPGGGYGPPGAPGGYQPPGAPPGGYPPAGGYPPPGYPPQGDYPPPGYPMGPPGAPGGGPPRIGSPDPELEKEISKWFGLSILSIFCGCGLLGLINVYMAHLAKQALMQGDLSTARDKIKTARLLCIVGYVLFALYFLGTIAYVLMMFVFAASSA